MRCNKTIVYLLSLGLGIMAADAMAANVIYRWVDENGVVHFSNQPPNDAQATIVDANSMGSSRAAESSAPVTDGSGSEQAGDATELSYAERRRQERAERRTQYSEKQRELEARCETMIRQRDSVVSRPNVLVTGEDGVTRRLDDEERLTMLNEAEAFIAENCR